MDIENNRVIESIGDYFTLIKNIGTIIDVSQLISTAYDYTKNTSLYCFEYTTEIDSIIKRFPLVSVLAVRTDNNPSLFAINFYSMDSVTRNKWVELIKTKQAGDSEFIKLLADNNHLLRRYSFKNFKSGKMIKIDASKISSLNVDSFLSKVYRANAILEKESSNV